MKRNCLGFDKISLVPGERMLTAHQDKKTHGNSEHRSTRFTNICCHYLLPLSLVLVRYLFYVSSKRDTFPSRQQILAAAIFKSVKMRSILNMKDIFNRRLCYLPFFDTGVFHHSICSFLCFFAKCNYARRN